MVYTTLGPPHQNAVLTKQFSTSTQDTNLAVNNPFGVSVLFRSTLRNVRTWSAKPTTSDPDYLIARRIGQTASASTSAATEHTCKQRSIQTAFQTWPRLTWFAPN